MPVVLEDNAAFSAVELKNIASHSCRTVPDASPLRFDVETDGGEFSKEYGCRNVLQDDKHCYCSHSRRNVNLVCKYSGRSPYILTSVVVEAPSVGFTAPVGQGLVFCTWEKPTDKFIQATKRWDNVTTRAEYNRLKALHCREGTSNDGSDPVAFFDLTYSPRTTVAFDFARSGRYVVVKLVSSKACDSSNIDVQYIGFRGWTRPQPIATASYC